MKKLILAGAVALFGMVSAQTKFGARAGYSMSTLSLSSEGMTVKSDAKSTFYVGGLVEHKLNDKFALQGEVLYSDLGGKYSAEGSEAKIDFGTLLVPISAKYFITPEFSAQAGLNFGFVLSAKANDTDVKNEVNSFNLAPHIGMEYALSNGVFFDTRYNFGVTNLSKDNAESLKNSFW